MKAAVYYETGPPDVFRYEDVPDPAVSPGSVVIDVEAISIDASKGCGSRPAWPTRQQRPR